MSPSETRATVTAYHRVQSLLNQPLPDDVKDGFREYLAYAETACLNATRNSAPARWARSIVSPVLAAGVGAALPYWRDDPANAGAALRMFGLTGERSLTSQAAWKLMQPYIWEPVVSEQVLATIRRKTALRLNRLPPDPAPADVLIELTRSRTGGFPVQMSHWLAEYFREHRQDEGPYCEVYRRTLVDLSVQNQRGELVQYTGPGSVHGRYTREEWEELIRGRVPESRLEVRAAYLVVKQFIAEYWAKWNPQKTLAAS